MLSWQYVPGRGRGLGRASARLPLDSGLLLQTARFRPKCFCKVYSRLKWC